MNAQMTTMAGRRRGFTFAEVMFAVVILGIGFIMLAAIFPVAIQQNQQTSTDAVSTAVVQQAVATLQQPGLGSVLSYNATTLNGNPGTLKPGVFYSPFGQWTDWSGSALSFGNVYLTSTNEYLRAWNSLAGKLVSGSDPRFGWTFAYRTVNANTIEAVIFVAQAPAQRVSYRSKNNTNGVTDDTDDLLVNSSGQTPATLMLKRLRARVVTYGGTQPDRLYFDTGTSSAQTKQLGCLGEGCYVLVADADVNNVANGYQMPSGGNKNANGVIFRLGAAVTDSTTASGKIAYELVPGQDLMAIGKPGTNEAAKPPYKDNTSSPLAAPSGSPIEVLVLGKALAQPGLTDLATAGATTITFSGQPMDLAVYRTTIGLK